MHKFMRMPDTCLMRNGADNLLNLLKIRLKMKPLKIENEVDSNMKSTIRYTFVAPGAIGKGWGQGLKSMGEKGKTPSNSLLRQSSDLVKKYIKEIKTKSAKEVVYISSPSHVL
ncbi:hypothetical protein RDI58_000983 [Solanum bulbocastanum]|uniref:Uncharacterized protein n=1 Tax=Solanum bulbocastanum TaxID=147425 RepID=A0AAN8U491_SOLBU